MKWREDDTIRFYRDTPDKRGVSEMVINNRGGGLHRYFGQHCKRINRIMKLIKMYLYPRGWKIGGGNSNGLHPNPHDTQLGTQQLYSIRV